MKEGRQVNQRLYIARGAALMIMLLCILILLWSLFLFPSGAATNLEFIRPESNWSDALLLAAIRAAGYTVEMLAYLHLAIVLFPALFYLAVGGIIFVRRSTDWFSLYLSVLFVIIATVANGMARLVANLNPTLGIIISGLGNAGWVGLVPIFYLFPNGTFVPSWTRWVPGLWGVFVALLLVDAAGLVQGLGAQVRLIAIPLVLLIFLGAAGSQVYRYFNHSNTLERQQTKWVLVAIVLFVVTVALSLGRIALSNPAQQFTAMDLQVHLVFDILFGVAAAFFPVSIGIAILRYRLWDIDIIIRKTATYTLLVALLALVYFGSVILLQQVLVTVTGSGRNEFVTVLTTLIIAALFVPLRNWIQSVIDKRFYRKKYDAQKVLQDFAQTVRDETDLEKLTGRLIEVVNETMQPKSVSLWLKAENSARRDK